MDIKNRGGISAEDSVTFLVGAHSALFIAIPIYKLTSESEIEFKAYFLSSSIIYLLVKILYVNGITLAYKKNFKLGKIKWLMCFISDIIISIVLLGVPIYKIFVIKEWDFSRNYWIFFFEVLLFILLFVRGYKKAKKSI